jgi:hypothetical protein
MHQEGRAMFGIGKTKTPAELQREQDIENQKLAARQLLQSMHGVEAEKAAVISEKIKLFLQTDKLLPFNIRQKINKRMRELECEANMRAADRLLREAAALLERHDLRERGQKLADSRRYFAKVCNLGGDEVWKAAYRRLCETIMLSGGVEHDAPSRAKPPDLAPKPPNRAKEPDAVAAAPGRAKE